MANEATVGRALLEACISMCDGALPFASLVTAALGR